MKGVLLALAAQIGMEVIDLTKIPPVKPRGRAFTQAFGKRRVVEPAIRLRASGNALRRDSP